MEQGLKITVEEMKCVETSAYIPSSMFTRYYINPNEDIIFKISLKIFTECLHIFGDDGSPTLKLIYKGPGYPLSLLYAYFYIYFLIIVLFMLIINLESNIVKKT